MIGLDTNILVRYYIDDAADAGTIKQRDAARRLIDSGQALAICKTVILELEWVLRGYYRFAPQEVLSVFRHLLSMPQISFEDRETVQQAISHMEAGLDFADALHHSSYRHCTSMASFDDRRFARRAARLGMAPRVGVPV